MGARKTHWIPIPACPQFARHKGRWCVVSPTALPFGATVSVRGRNNSSQKVVITGNGFKVHRVWLHDFADVGTPKATRARQTARENKAQSGPLERTLEKRPRECVSGMDERDARTEARRRGHLWRPYECTCGRWHVVQEVAEC